MDNPPAGRAPAGGHGSPGGPPWGPGGGDGPSGPSWGPARWLSSLTLAGMLAALAWRLLDHDPENRLVASVLVVVCALVTLALVRIRTRLRVVGDGIVVTGPLRSRHLVWDRLAGIAAPQRGRFGRRAAMLELEVTPGEAGPGDPQDPEADTELLTFGRFDLGTDPAAVARELQRRRPAD